MFVVIVVIIVPVLFVFVFVVLPAHLLSVSCRSFAVDDFLSFCQFVCVVVVAATFCIYIGVFCCRLE